MGCNGTAFINIGPGAAQAAFVVRRDFTLEISFCLAVVIAAAFIITAVLVMDVQDALSKLPNRSRTATAFG